MELSLSDDIVYGNYTCCSPLRLGVYGARTTRHGASEADSEPLGRSNLGICYANVPRCVLDIAAVTRHPRFMYFDGNFGVTKS